MARQPNTVHTLLLTGASGVGKTTVIRRVADALRPHKIQGFLTEEIREGGRRVGFCLNSFDGQRAVLAHLAIRSPARVGTYGVDVQALERVVDATLRPSAEGQRYLIIDEIGPMECCSPRFVTAMTALLDSHSVVIATIHRSRRGFMGQVKERTDVELWEVTLENRDEMPSQVLSWIRRQCATRAAE